MSLAICLFIEGTCAMQHQLETQFNCRIIQWAEPNDDGLEFSAFVPGEGLIVADSAALLILALMPVVPVYQLAA